MSIGQQMVPEHRMHTVTIDEIISLGERLDREHPSLEHYFSPTRRERFIKDYLHYLNTSLLDARHGKMDLKLYLLLVLSFQFLGPLLEIPMTKEMSLFLEILGKVYDLDDPDVNIHFSFDEIEDEPEKDQGILSNDWRADEEEALAAFRDELEDSYEGRREVKESVQKRLKQDGISSIKKWQELKGLTELAEAFGRCIVIPALFSFMDKKLLGFYRQTTRGIRYEVVVPDLD